jgi:sulfite exporter TauE/SafE/copper chaperone CopZ/heme/copper-type cytochrome/quinol oxidase subunit 2
MSAQYLSRPIKGMHCPSCELLIEEKLEKVKHVFAVDVNHKKATALIYYKDTPPDDKLIEQAIKEAGYEIGSDSPKTFFTRDKKEYDILMTAALAVATLYLVLKLTGLTSIGLGSDLSHPSWGLILLIGLVAGISTCMALVGGLSLGLSAKFAENHPQATAVQKFRPHLFFMLGRILSYALLGGVLGMLGKAFQISSKANGILIIIVAVVMLIMGLQLINIFPRLNNFKLVLPKALGKFFGLAYQSKEYSHKNAMLMGALTFFLPCGFTQAMQLYAVSTGNFAAGALIMGLFAIGTAPGLLSIGGLSSVVRGSFKTYFFKIAGLAVILFALFNLHNGFALVGLNTTNFIKNGTNSNQIVKDPNVVWENGVQVVRMAENDRGYSPNKFNIKKGSPVKWIIDAQAPYSCASTIVIPKLNIQKSLRAGENIIEFTPTEVGIINFSCSMGMYTGAFNVYDDVSDVQSAANKKTADNSLIPSASASANTAASGGSCGSGGSGGACGCGGGSKKIIDTNAKPAVAETISATTNQEAVQIIKATYTNADYLSPTTFKVKAGTKVRLEIAVQDTGVGCGYALTIPGLDNDIKPLQAGVPIVMEFTPTTPGSYNITCSMDMIRFGLIIVE